MAGEVMHHPLRPYQQEAVDAAIAFMRRSVDPFCIEAATGAGKSHIIAEIARQINETTGKRILCLAPSAELIVQNREKYLASGNRASMFSASAGAKELRYPVVFGSPLTVKNRISRFMDDYGLVVMDEAHGLTPTVKDIIAAMREGNPRLRVCGLTATPYRLGTGWIFRMHPDGKVNGDDTARDPYFVKCVYKIQARELIAGGFLTEPIIGQTGATGYDTGGLVANAMGKFDADAVDKAYHGHGRKTAAIVADVVAQSADRQGVMFFAATVQHAKEVMASLPPELSAIVTGETPKGERDTILKRFKSKALKYIVNVSVLTTGFDAPHVDVIAILRKTESVGLLQQIIGRGLRIAPGKVDCRVLDYTTNLDDHCPDGDLFAPIVRAVKAATSEGGLTCVCPICEYENLFAARVDMLESPKDKNGYCTDLAGNQVLVPVFDADGNQRMKPMPGHWGRRCMGMTQTGTMGSYERCGYRWTGKECPECQADNDIAARYCCECKAEIVDPNDKLVMEFKALKRDPTKWQVDRVISMTCKPTVSQKGNPTIRIEWVTPYRQFATWVQPEAKHSRGQAEYARWMTATDDGQGMPSSITYRKDASTGFYEVAGYGETTDEQSMEMVLEYS